MLVLMYTAGMLGTLFLLNDDPKRWIYGIAACLFVGLAASMYSYLKARVSRLERIVDQLKERINL